MAMSKNQRLALKSIRNTHLRVLAEGARMVAESGVEPAATAGVLTAGFDEWQPGKSYALNEPFRYGGMTGFARQQLTAQEIYPPFSAGTEALYGVRPAPDADGVYPYVYSMAVAPGMRVRDGGTVYRCIQPANPLLYAPGDAPALFVKEDIDE